MIIKDREKKVLNKNLNILFIAERMVVGGAERHTINKAKGLRERGHTVYIVSAGGPLVKEIQELGIEHFDILTDVVNKETISFPYFFKDLNKIIEIIKKYKIDVINCMPQVPFYLAQLIYKTLDIPVVYEVLSPVYQIRGMNKEVKELAEYGGVVAPILYPDGLLQAKEANMDINQIDQIPLFVDTEKFRPQVNDSLRNELGISRDTKLIMTISRFDHFKVDTIKELLDVFPMLSEYHNIALVLIGDGEFMNELQDKAKGFDNVHFLGIRKDIEILLQSCDIFIGMGLSAMQAAACRKPSVLAHYTGGTIGCFGEDPYGSIGGDYPGATIKPLVNELLPLIESPEIRKRVAEKGYLRIINNHSFKNVIDQWERKFIELKKNFIPNN